MPLGQLAAVRLTRGPAAIRTENALLSTYIYVDIPRPRHRRLRRRGAPGGAGQGEDAAWPLRDRSGQFEYMERAIEKLKIVVPLTIFIIFLLLYMRRITETRIVMLSMPLALVGGIWYMDLLGFNLSVAVAVGPARPKPAASPPPEVGVADVQPHVRRRRPARRDADDRDRRPGADSAWRRAGR